MIEQNSSRLVLSTNAVSPLAPFGPILFADTPYKMPQHQFADYVPVDTTGGTIEVRLPSIGSEGCPVGRVISIVKLTTALFAVMLTPGAADAIDFTGVVGASDSTLLDNSANISRVQLQASVLAGVNRWMPLSHSVVA